MSVLKVKDTNGNWMPIDSVEVVKKNVEGTKPYIPKVAYQRYVLGCENINATPDYSDLSPNITVTVDAIDTRGIIDWSYFFELDKNLPVINLIDTRNGANFHGMFNCCEDLTTIPQIDTGNGTNFEDMFNSCTNLTNIPQIDTGNGTNFKNMFRDCNKIESIFLLDTHNGTNFDGMFYNCKNLTTITQIDTTNLISCTNMFSGCTKLTNITICGELDLPTQTTTRFPLDLSQCRKLSVESIMNIINACKDYTGLGQRTIKLGTSNIAKLSEEQKAVATNKNIRLTI